MANILRSILPRIYLLLLTMMTLRFTQAFISKGRQAFVHSSSRSFSTAHMSTQMTPESLFASLSDAGARKWVGNDVANAMHSLYIADAVCFDVDSTVVSEEGIDVLADVLGKGPEVAALTKQAMNGDTKFQDALQMRLDLLQPSKAKIEECLRVHPLVLTSGIGRLMASLQDKNVDIWLVSGGFRIMIEPVASELKIPIANIVANTILFDEDGKYAGFDRDEPTSRDMGKPKALEQIKSLHNYETMIMVGDGATDAQAKPPAKAFIGFGGIVVREPVQRKADWFVTDFDDMSSIIEMRE